MRITKHSELLVCSTFYSLRTTLCGTRQRPAPRYHAGMSSSSVEITVNGELRSVAADSTIADLLTELGLAGTPCAVEVNRALVPRAEHAATRLEADDALELVTFVGGG